VLGELVAQASHRFGDRPFEVAVAGWELSYRDLDVLSAEVAAGMLRAGVREGDVVALVLPAVPEYMVSYVAAAKIGAVTAGVNPRLSEAEREKVLAVAEPKIVLATADLAPGSGEVVEVEPAEHPDEVLSGFRARGEPLSRIVPDDPERPVAIVFTSGTTGTPKGALFCNRQLAAVTSIDVGDAWDGGGRTIAGTALAHLGPMTKLPGSIRRGVTTHMVRRWDAEEALRLTSELRITTIGGIPTQVALMLRVKDFDSYDLSCVRSIVIGGGPATASLVREARERFGVPLGVRYSCTEAAIGTGTQLTDPPEDAEVSVGRPLRGVELAVLDEEDRPVAGGAVGSVAIRSAAVMSGYYHDEAATREAFTAEGYVRTGDVGWVDERGRLHLVGRDKEMYVRGGYNVYPVEVEGVLSEHPAVAAVAVVPRPDEVMGETGVAVVVPRRGRPAPGLDELRSFGRKRLASYKLPDDVRVVESLPLTSMEKLDRQALKAAVVG
jgi:acyl-CoA synthetase (AMP-forming)/AMP-acid ligase II